MTAHGWLRAVGRTWQIGGAGVYAGQKVSFRLCPFLAQGVRVWDGEGVELTALPLDFDTAGFSNSPLSHQWDDAEQKGAAAAMSPARRLNQAVRSGEHVAPAIDPWASLDDLEQRQAYVAKQGAEWAPTAAATLGETRMDHVEAREEVARRLDRELSRDEGRWWKERVGDGITAAELDDAIAAFTNPQTADQTRRNLA